MVDGPIVIDVADGIELARCERSVT